MIADSDKLTREYYGCTIHSTPTADDCGDGWIHVVSRDGREYYESNTLADAIRFCKAAQGIDLVPALPVVVDSPVEMELAEQLPLRKRKK